MANEKVITVNEIEYIVSSDGKIYSTKNCGRGKYHKEITQRKRYDGYLTITTGKTGSRKQFPVHRMVAMAFLPNPNNLPEVNHKDCNRENNNVENLEWCTRYYNIQYSISHKNHISTKNIFGENNPNYGNHKLSQMYKNNPEFSKEKNSRPLGSNGRAREIEMFDKLTGVKCYYDCMVSCARYLIDNSLIAAKNVNSVLSRISFCAQSGKLYYKRFTFCFVE